MCSRTLARIDRSWWVLNVNVSTRLQIIAKKWQDHKFTVWLITTKPTKIMLFWPMYQNPESSKIWLLESEILNDGGRNPDLTWSPESKEFRIWNLEGWNPESRGLESGIQRIGIPNPGSWNLESRTSVDSVKWVKLFKDSITWNMVCFFAGIVLFKDPTTWHIITCSLPGLVLLKGAVTYIRRAKYLVIVRFKGPVT